MLWKEPFEIPNAISPAVADTAIDTRPPRALFSSFSKQVFGELSGCGQNFFTLDPLPRLAASSLLSEKKLQLPNKMRRSVP